MQVSHISNKIIKIIDRDYSKFNNNESVDLTQIKNICNLYKPKNQKGQPNTTLSDIAISTPEFKKFSTKGSKHQTDLLNSSEFSKKYIFFIRIIYASLEIGVEIFDIDDDSVTLKNNYQFLRALETKKKKLISDHLVVLKEQYKNINQKIGPEYEKFSSKNTTKIKIIDRITELINKLILNGIFDRTDNLLTLLLPYFYVYTEFIEEYN